ncbi:MAG: hypothetical protein OQJ89_00870 [Kangiellaceae bacterium]|nr:hypothetical protein [Kangiellaceae bacterium]MCW9015493.1 hypothetical protein [Kangiellaceae bacterium]
MEKFFTKRYALIAVALVGIVISVLIVKLQPVMTHNPQARPSVPVSFIEIPLKSISPQIIGFGNVKPDLSLQAKAEVTGRVTYIHPNLKKGEIYPAETLLLKIDDKDYLLQLKQAEADVLANQANLKEMQLTIENNELELKLAQEKLKVRDKEYKRLQKLRKSGSVSQSKLDAERQNLLQQQQEVQQLKNKKTTLPSDLEVMKAQLAIAESKLEKSRRDLERTEIRLPFNGRISQVYAELDQYVATGTQLFDASGLDKIVVNAQFPIDQFSAFARGFKRDKLQKINFSDYAGMTQMLASLGLTAEIEMVGGTSSVWQAKVERFSDELDPQTKTVGVTVSVSGNYRDIEPGKKPPLLEGMYMKVSLFGAASEFAIIPRFAIQNNEVYLIDNEHKLSRTKISPQQFKGELALLKKADLAGQKLITSDVFPAVSGMAVTPIQDNAALEKVNTWLEGK